MRLSTSAGVCDKRDVRFLSRIGGTFVGQEGAMVKNQELLVHGSREYSYRGYSKQSGSMDNKVVGWIQLSQQWWLIISNKSRVSPPLNGVVLLAPGKTPDAVSLLMDSFSSSCRLKIDRLQPN
ncbi:hypothetical protein KM043_002162 [Ampulex compressa]|nr:hypothetical protein KM043_002162 [Ampulex compressa]